MRVSVVLDRRRFLLGAAGAMTVVSAALSAGGGWRLALEPPCAPSDWAVDHIFGTYPPYAHPIPYGRQTDAVPAQLATGELDPLLMI